MRMYKCISQVLHWFGKWYFTSNLVILCVCVCVCVCVFCCVEMEERRDYTSWRVAEDGGKKLFKKFIRIK